MEVDLLCADAQLAVELDGAQHLGDAKAYRKDCRKDALLQENGYTIMRFLTEDVAKRLDEVLDSILRALVRAHELWLHKNPKSLKIVEEGLKQSKEGKVHSRGSFSKYVETNV